MFSQNPYCFWCGTELVHPKTIKRHQTEPDNMATIDHLHDRFDKERLNGDGTKERTVLSCGNCNNERSIKRQASLGKEELWRRSGRKPREMVK